jgi:MFS family permease
MGAMALVNAQTLLPSVIQGLHGPEWLVALMPAIMTVGFLGPPLFTAHAIGGLGHFRPLLLWTGSFQRLAYLGAALVLLFADDPLWCLIAVAVTPLISGLCGGISLTAWQQLLTRTVAPERRSSLFAWRYVIGSLIGVLGGWVVHATLAAQPGMRGYGLLHLWAFLILIASYVIFATIREPEAPARREPETGLWDNVRAMPTLLWADRRLVRVLISIAAFTLTGALVPYLAIHARHVCGAPESFLGELVGWQMAGAIAGGLAAGWVGDRHGGKLPLQAGRLLFLAVCALAPFAASAWAWRLLFLAFGAAFNACMVGTNTVQLDILPEHGRANRLAIMSVCQLPTTIIASLIGGTAWNAAGEAAFPWLAAGAAAALAVSILVLARMPEPRSAHA